MKKSFKTSVLPLAVAGMLFAFTGCPGDGGSGGGGGGSSTCDPLENTTWVFEKKSNTTGSCNLTHYVPPANPNPGTGGGTGTGSGSGSGYPGTGGGSDPWNPGSGSGGGTGSGGGGVSNEPTVTGTTQDTETQNYSESFQNSYLRIEADSTAYYGYVKYTESGTKSRVKTVTTWSNGSSDTDYTDWVYTPTSTSAKTYEPVAKGTAVLAGGKYKFNFLYQYMKETTGVADDGGYYDDETNTTYLYQVHYNYYGDVFYYDENNEYQEGYPPVYESNNTKYYWYAGLTDLVRNELAGLCLLNASNKYVSFDNVSAINGGKLRLTYNQTNGKCSDKISATQQCTTTWTNYYYAHWNAETFNEAMRGNAAAAEKNNDVEPALKKGAFVQECNPGDTTKTYIRIVSTVACKIADGADNLGDDYYFVDEKVQNIIDGQWSYTNGKFTVAYRNTSDRLQRFVYDAEVDEEGNFVKIKDNAGYNPVDLVFADKVVNSSIYDKENFGYTHWNDRKGQAPNLSWTKQNAVWKSEDGNTVLACDGTKKVSGADLYTYTVTFDGKDYEIYRFARNNDTYVLAGKADSTYHVFTLTDSMSEDGVTLVNGDTSAVLKYDSRYGYDEANYKEFNLSGEVAVIVNNETIFGNYDYSDVSEDKKTVKVKLPVEKRVSAITQIYENTAVGGTGLDEGYEIKVTDASDNKIEATTKIGDIEGNVLKFAKAKEEGAITIKVKLDSAITDKVLRAPEGSESKLNGDVLEILIGPRTAAFNLVGAVITDKPYADIGGGTGTGTGSGSGSGTSLEYMANSPFGAGYFNPVTGDFYSDAEGNHYLGNVYGGSSGGEGGYEGGYPGYEGGYPGYGPYGMVSRRLDGYGASAYGYALYYSDNGEDVRIKDKEAIASKVKEGDTVTIKVYDKNSVTVSLTMDFSDAVVAEQELVEMFSYAHNSTKNEETGVITYSNNLSSSLLTLSNDFMTTDVEAVSGGYLVFTYKGAEDTEEKLLFLCDYISDGILVVGHVFTPGLDYDTTLDDVGINDDGTIFCHYVANKAGLAVYGIEPFTVRIVAGSGIDRIEKDYRTLEFVEADIVQNITGKDFINRIINNYEFVETEDDYRGIDTMKLTVKFGDESIQESGMNEDGYPDGIAIEDFSNLEFKKDGTDTFVVSYDADFWASAY